MTTLTLSARAQTHPHMRALNILHDLPSVANLIDLCFSNTMDSEGRQYIQDMRRAGSDNSFIQWANRAAESTSLPLTGYVWEEAGKIIGNVSLVPFRHQKEKIYLIANVAAHPDHRRRGIARALTERAIEHAREKKVANAWLHVRDDNPGAIDLYSQLGFTERARRTSWQAHTDARAEYARADILVTKRNPRDWNLQREWLERAYPASLSWHRSWDFDSLKPGFWKWLYLFFMDINVHQWAAYQNDEMQAALASIPNGRGESLFAAIDEQADPAALAALLSKARRDLFHWYSKINFDFPVGKFDTAIQFSGFQATRTLIWMQATL